nr:hypothetical protein [Thiobacillaceae bacterium]
MRPSTWRPERIRRIGPLLAGWLALVPASHADAPDFARVRADWRPSEAWLLDRHGVPLQELRLDARGRRTDWTPLA